VKEVNLSLVRKPGLRTASEHDVKQTRALRAVVPDRFEDEAENRRRFKSWSMDEEGAAGAQSSPVTFYPLGQGLRPRSSEGAGNAYERRRAAGNAAQSLHGRHFSQCSVSAAICAPRWTGMVRRNR